jgi:hypothetical protein
VKACILALLLCSTCVWAEPGNAPDVRGRFVLVVGGTATGKFPGGSWGYKYDIEYRIAPVVIGVFDSFKLCTGAGRELQARLNTDGYVLDFACVAEGR